MTLFFPTSFSSVINTKTHRMAGPSAEIAIGYVWNYYFHFIVNILLRFSVYRSVVSAEMHDIFRHYNLKVFLIFWKKVR